MPADSRERVARPTQFGEMLAVTAGVAIWAGIVAQQGWEFGLKYSILLLIAVPLGAWTLLMRLRYRPGSLRMTIGPWRRAVDLNALESINWRMTGAWRSQGTIFVTDHHGKRVPIYVGRFNRIEEWGPLLLDAAERCNATVDRYSRTVLSQEMRQVRPA